MSKRGRYLGGHSTGFRDPRGPEPIPDRRPKKIRNQESKLLSDQLQKTVDRDSVRIAAERAALRKFEVTGGDEVALGVKSSGWIEYRELLRTKLKFLTQKANIHRADQISATLNRSGFKTGSGQQWTPRLVQVAKSILQPNIKKSEKVGDQLSPSTGRKR